MAFFIYTDNGFLGTKGIFRVLQLFDRSKATLWEIIPHNQDKNEYYICDEQKQHFIKRYRDEGLSASGNREYRAIITIDVPDGLRTGSKFTMHINGIPVGIIGDSIKLGLEPEEFILSDGNTSLQHSHQEESSASASESSIREEPKPDEKSNTPSEVASFEISPTLSSDSTRSNAKLTAVSRHNSSVSNKNVTDKIQANLAKIQTVLEDRIVDLQKDMDSLLRQSEACAMLAEKCQRLEESKDRLTSMSINNREKYQKHLNELLDILPQENIILFDCEGEVATKLEDVLIAAEEHQDFMETHLSTMVKEYQKIISNIAAIKEEQAKYAEQIRIQQPVWLELHKWHKENVAVAQSLGSSNQISDILDDIKRRLVECDKLLGEEIAAINNNINPQLIGFN